MGWSHVLLLERPMMTEEGGSMLTKSLFHRFTRHSPVLTNASIIIEPRQKKNLSPHLQTFLSTSYVGLL
jgi:hypothetical protein